MWKLNDSLIQIPSVIEKVSRELWTFFSSDAIPESSPMIVWETHKAYIRGSFIKIGTFLKKERNKQIMDLLGKSGALESVHKKCCPKPP